MRTKQLRALSGCTVLAAGDSQAACDEGHGGPAHQHSLNESFAVIQLAFAALPCLMDQIQSRINC